MFSYLPLSKAIASRESWPKGNRAFEILSAVGAPEASPAWKGWEKKQRAARACRRAGFPFALPHPREPLRFAARCASLYLHRTQIKTLLVQRNRHRPLI